MSIKKTFVIFCLAAAALLSCCGRKASPKVETTIEDGVEVILNGTKPYQVRGTPGSLVLEEQFRIDMESARIIKTGLTDVRDFDVDSQGCLFFKARQNSSHAVFKFDNEGRYITSFGRWGEGPEELRFASFMCIDSRDEIIVTDPSKLVIFDNNGTFVREIPKSGWLRFLIPLADGNYMGYFLQTVRNKITTTDYCVRLYDPDLKELKELGRYKQTDFTRGKGIEGVDTFIFAASSADRIYTGKNRDRYEIEVYDLKGDLIRKIRKEYIPVPVSDEYKQRVIKSYESPQNSDMRKYLYFPKNMPPYQAFFSDDEGRLYVKTYEKDQNSEDFVYDIFSREGIFIGRTGIRSIENLFIFTYARVRKGMLYALQVKESGYKVLVAYKMLWN